PRYSSSSLLSSSLSSSKRSSSIFVLSKVDRHAFHEKLTTTKVMNGGLISIKTPAPTTTWHRKFKDDRSEQHMESCIDVCKKWRSGSTVSTNDSAEYFTNYRVKGIHHYSYFNVATES
ncbi:hypothetical protein PMAYCL1PPCAC_21465, partial [Pristionchus mayeri]